MNGMPVKLDRAIEELAKYRHGLKVMSGGFTLSGGEPLMQDRFAVRLFTGAKAMGIHTALDTNGHLGDRLSNEELDLIDVVLLDLKMWNPTLHLRLTGKEVGPTLDFARRLAQRQRKIWLRYVLVPGLTDDENDINQIAAFAAGLGNVERVDVLPFHQMGATNGKSWELTTRLTMSTSGARTCRTHSFSIQSLLDFKLFDVGNISLSSLCDLCVLCVAVVYQ